MVILRQKLYFPLDPLFGLWKLVARNGKRDMI
jgi:hypothetical protein